MRDDKTVVGRAALVVYACLADDDPISLAEMTAQTELPKPTVRRIAEQLVTHGLLQRTPRGYLSGPGLRAAGARAAQHQRRQSAVLPFLTDLHARTGAAVWVVDTGNLDCNVDGNVNGNWPVLGTVYGRQAATSGYAEVWPRQPRDPAILATALGRLALTRRPELVHELLRAGPRRLTPFTDVSPARILAAVERAGANQESVEHGGVVRGWSCIAVQIPGTGSATSLVLGLVKQTTQFREASLLAAAHAAAAGLGKQLTPPPRAAAT